MTDLSFCVNSAAHQPTTSEAGQGGAVVVELSDRLGGASGVAAPAPVLPADIVPMGTASDRSVLGDLNGCASVAVSALVGGASSVAVGALMGFVAGAVGGAVLDNFDSLPESFTGNAILAGTQGAAGTAVLYGAFGMFQGAVTGALVSLGGRQDGASSWVGRGVSNLGGSGISSIAGNALGNVILAAQGKEHTGQLEGLAATATGVGTLSAALTVLGLSVLCCCGTGAIIAAVAKPK